MTDPTVVVGGPPHKHVNPLYMQPNMRPWVYRWNTVVLSDCGHLYVRRHSMGWLLPLHDHYPQWVRLRPWHVAACVQVIHLRLLDVIHRG